MEICPYFSSVLRFVGHLSALFDAIKDDCPTFRGFLSEDQHSPAVGKVLDSGSWERQCKATV